jgi:PAS domain S-box-containing protein
MDVSYYPIFANNGTVSGIVHISRDITKLKKIEISLRESEEKYRSMMEAMDDAAYICSPDFRIEYMNPAMIKRIGYETIGEACHKVMHGLEEKCPWCIHGEVMRGEYIKTEVVSPKDGRDFLVSCSPIFHTDGSISKFTIFRDITEYKKLEAQLRHAQKMESIGTLAGGIAHNFNNILSIILGNAELAVDDVPDRSLAKECLDEIRTAALRASKEVQQILSFARKQVTEPEPVQLTPIIKDCLRLLRSSIPATIEISQDISCEVDTVFADPTQMSQVLMNLCTNAAQAMGEDAGILKVTLKNVELENQDKELDVTPGRYVSLNISDTGHGISPEIIDRIFDPYFTTKEVGTSTGMGLSVVHGIVKSCHGTIIVHSESGKGTVFEVFLPVSEAKTELNAKEPEALHKGNENILFIDDEESIGKVVKRILEHFGYQVETKTNPAEALELFRSGPDRFDLVITDMTMPQMTGQRLVKEILNIRPDMPIILCTGFSEKISEEKAGEVGINALVFKPFVVRDFSLTVRKVLDEK